MADGYSSSYQVDGCVYISHVCIHICYVYIRMLCVCVCVCVCMVAQQ